MLQPCTACYASAHIGMWLCDSCYTGSRHRLVTPFGGRTSHPRAHSHTWRATLKVLGFSLLVLLPVCVATVTSHLHTSTASLHVLLHEGSVQLPTPWHLKTLQRASDAALAQCGQFWGQRCAHDAMMLSRCGHRLTSAPYCMPAVFNRSPCWLGTRHERCGPPSNTRVCANLTVTTHHIM